MAVLSLPTEQDQEGVTVHAVARFYLLDKALLQLMAIAAPGDWEKFFDSLKMGGAAPAPSASAKHH